MKTVLVVDDEQNIRDIVKAYLQKEGYRVLTAADGIEALEVYKNSVVDMIILDLMMPRMTGQEVCTLIRQKSNIPIIMLTAKVEEEHLIAGIKNGADDYVRKPFSVRELMVRVSAIFRRTQKNSPMVDIYAYNHDQLVVDFQGMRVKKEGVEVILTPNEFKILKTLILNAEIVLTREQIIEKTFGIHFDGFDRTVDTHIKNLRQKLEDNPRNPEYIKTIYSMGYKFCTEKTGEYT